MKVSELFEDEERSVLSVMGKQPDIQVGSFCCSDLALTSLEGAPTEVGATFTCTNNNLTSLKGAPTSVGDDFYCMQNKLISLIGAPTLVGDGFYCSDNMLTSLEGAPSSVGNYFVCSRNQLTSLHNIHKHIKYIGNFANFENNPIKSHVLGLLLIEGLKRVALQNLIVQSIINRHLDGERDVFACQEELLDAGLDDFAKL